VKVRQSITQNRKKPGRKQKKNSLNRKNENFFRR
jgi:hypothetical protein